MNKPSQFPYSLFTALSLLLLPVAPAGARPRPPLPPLPEPSCLRHWSFDEAWWSVSDPALALAEDRVESWSGLALVRNGHPILPVIFPALEGTSHVSVAEAGAIRFWFRPYWASTTAGGAGPAERVCLLDWIAVTGEASVIPQWSLQVRPDGSALVLYSSGTFGVREVLRAGITWPAGAWHLLALNYGPQGTALFVDGELAAEGSGVPGTSAALSGLVVGSALDGTGAAGGEFEELYAFGLPLSEESVAAYWQHRAGLAALGPITPEEAAARRAAALLVRQRQTPAAQGGHEGGYGPLDAGGCVTNGVPWLTNVVCASTTNGEQVITFDLAGGTNGVPYDILTATNLTASGSNVMWRWLQQGFTCGGYVFTNPPQAQAFYALGWNVDLDHDGMSDWWEAAHGLAPFVNDADQDPDDDGVSNRLEYQNLSDPFDNMLVAWGDDASGQSTVPWGFPAVRAMAGGGGTGAGGHTLVLTPGGTVVAWGANNYGQTNVPSGLSNVVAVAAGGDQSVALKGDGAVVQWGRWFADVPPGLTNAKTISAGYQHVLALRTDGTVVAWGRSNCPANVVPSNLSGVRAIAAGWNHNLALKSNGTVVAWGLNASSLGWNLTNAPAGLTDIAAIAAGALHSVALRSNGTVVAWGSNSGGETNVPTGLSNVTAIAAGRGYTLALLSDSTVAGWGPGAATPPEGLTNVTAIAAGPAHGLAIRKGAQKPLVLRQPRSFALPAGLSGTFQVSVASRQQPSYQWLRTNWAIAGATTSTFTLNNVQADKEGGYRVRVTNAAGTVTSQDAEFLLVTPPVLLSPTVPQKPWMMAGSNLTLTVSVQAGGTRLEPLRYLWSKDGQRVGVVPVSMLSNHVIGLAGPGSEGVYAVTITNRAGATSSPPWTVRVAFPGSAAAWGRNDANQADRPLGLSEVIAVAGGGKHSLALHENRTVSAWGGNDSGQTNVPTGLTNVVGIAAGSAHSLALLENGSVVAWGANGFGQTNVQAGLTNTAAVSAGGNQCLALLADGTVAQWGETNGPVPANLARVSAIASGANFHLALLTNGTVAAWGGNNHGQTNVPTGLANVAAIAAGGAHALALREDGTVVGWGDNASGQTNSPAGLTNAMAVAAGGGFSLALCNDGTVAAWGDNAWNQTNMIVGLNSIKRIAAGADHALAVVFSPRVQYPVDVTRDLLLIYNTASTNSIWVKDYYLVHRSLVSGANLLGVSCTTNERMATVTFTNQVLTPYLNWLNQHPTKRPQYVIWFYDLPGRVGDAAIPSPSPSYRLHTAAPGLPPFVTCINLRTTIDCKAYIDKLEFFGTTYSPGKLFISANKGGYGNTNFVLDGVRHGPGYGGTEDFSGRVGVVSNGVSGILAASVQGSQITFQDGIETNGASAFPPHILEATNVAGYISWGSHSRLGSQFAVNGAVRWFGESRWWIIETIESYNGLRDSPTAYQSNFLEWFSANGFGGTNYSNTPVGVVTYVEEPGLTGVNDAREYFGLWAKSQYFGSVAWNSTTTPFLQVVGDPFTKK